jgi:hypothetical protein
MANLIGKLLEEIDKFKPVFGNEIDLKILKKYNVLKKILKDVKKTGTISPSKQGEIKGKIDEILELLIKQKC